jgi:ABC-type glycerol-3-phosphate transport system substrate-binding protein
MVLLALLLLGSMVYAKGGSQQTGGDGIAIWNVHDPSSDANGRIHIAKYREYMDAHPGITVVHTPMIYDQLREKAIISGQARTGPDIIHMLGEWVPEFVQMGLLQDVTDQLKAWPDYSAFPASTWKVSTVNGRIYGIPSVASTRVLIYRDDMFREAGVTAVPKTWTELRETAKKLTRDTNGDGSPDVYGFAFCSSSKAVRGPQEFAVFLYSVNKGELAVQQGGKWAPGFTVDQAEKVLQFYSDLMFVDKSVPPFSIGWEYDEMDTNFRNGTLAMTQNGAWMSDASQMPDIKAVKTAAFPYHTNPSTYLEVKIEGFGSYGRQKAEALDFAKWLFGRDNMVQLYATDNLPARSDAAQSPLWKADPVWKGTFLDTVKDGFTLPAIPLAPILEATMASVQEVLYQRMTPRQSAQDFYNKVKNYLDTEVNN